MFAIMAVTGKSRIKREEIVLIRCSNAQKSERMP